jgi:hypothetical protein
MPAVFLNLSLWFFPNSPLNPKNSLSIAKSISSENLFISFQALLKEVPPLKTNK